MPLYEYVCGACGHRFEQIRIGGGDHANIDGNRFRTADALDLSFLQHTQKLGLQGQWHLTDLVQKNCSPMRLLEQAHAGIHGSCEGSLGMAEELGFEEMIRKRGAIHGHHSGR